MPDWALVLVVLLSVAIGAAYCYFFLVPYLDYRAERHGRSPE